MSDLDASDVGPGPADAPAASTVGPLIFPQFNYSQAATNPLVPYCPKGHFDCLNVRTSDNQIFTALWISALIGVTWLLVFGIFRDKIAVYRTRLDMPNVGIKPPPLPVGGIKQLWTWLYPVIMTSDAELIYTAGLDSLMLCWTNTLGIQIFAPLTVLGMVLLLPVNLAGTRIEQQMKAAAAGHPHAASSTFARLTLSNLRKGSSNYWFAFGFVYLATAYVCWLLVKYYQRYVVLRQHYLVGGESLINEWHAQFLAERRRSASVAARSEQRQRGSAVQLLTALRDRLKMDPIDEELDDSVSLAAGRMPSSLSQMSHLQAFVRRNSFEGHRSNLGLHQRASRASTPGPVLPPMAGARWSTLGDRRSGDGDDRGHGLPGAHVPTPYPLVHSLSIFSSRAPRPPLSPAGTPSPPSDSPYDKVSIAAEMPAVQLLPTYEPRRGSMPRPPKPQAMARRAESLGSEEVTPCTATGTPARGPRDVSASSWGRASAVTIGSHVGGGLISRYESHPVPPSARGSAHVHRWWSLGETSAHVQGAQMMGKPSVAFRKTVNVVLEEGREVGVQAQQYAVLVTDVPDLRSEADKLIEQAARQHWVMQAWRRVATLFLHHVLLRKPILASPRVPRSAELARRSRASAAAAWPRRRSGSGVPAGARQGSAAATENAGLMKPAGALSPPWEGGADVRLNIQGTPIKEPTASTISLGFRKPVIQLPDATEEPDAEVGAASAPAALGSEHGSAASGGSSSTGGEGEWPPPLGGGGGSGDAGEEEEEEDQLPDREELVVSTFRRLFPRSFAGVAAVHKHKEVDLLLVKWDQAWTKLASAEGAYEASGCKRRPQHRTGCCGCWGARVDSVDHWAGRVRELETNISAARKRARAAPPSAAFFAFFTSQKAAAIAAQANLHPEDGHSFRVTEAPGPEEVNWPTLWMSWIERDWREVLVLPLIAGIMLVPVGIFSGAVAQVTVAICDSSSVFHRLYSAWYCSRTSLGRSLITAIVPTVLLLTWQNLIMPNALYRFAQMEGRWHSLSGLDRRVCALFFQWSVWSVFLGAMLGGSAFSQLGALIDNPASLPSLIGTALPASSNFFINYIIIQGLAMVPFRLMYPHIGFLVGLFRLCGACKLRHKRERVAAVWPHSVRYGREVGTIMLMYIVALAYAASSPMILPFTLAYFIVSWVFWRYNVLYVSERCFESGGLFWDQIFSQICWCLFILEFFTGCIFMANRAFLPAVLLWATLTPALYKFARYCDIRYGSAVRQMPLETAAAAPLATVDPALYLAPALRPGCAGWYPESGKAWENWGAPVYTL
ncbi:hypothetical protein WJX81_003710 [Elliptochloris bilobata]|uniref:ERD4-related membrane protein n=1 Tax=Elliptochloris bilobata TaxID=381761 RepID=A0AAW1QA42_9CHLO